MAMNGCNPMGKYKSIRFFCLLIGFVFCLSSCKPLIHKLAFYPDTSDFPVHLPDAVEEVYIETEDGIHLHTYFLKNASDDFLIYFHGNAGNISHRIPTLQTLNKLGLNVLGISYRGYGKSEGQPSEKGIYLDGRAAYNHVTKTLKVKPENVIVFGRSLGSAVAVDLSQNKRLKGVILITPLSDAYDHAKAHGFGIFACIGKGVFDNKTKIKAVESPKLIIHGTKDEIIPFYLGKKLFDLAQGKKQFVEIINGSHNDLEFVDPNAFWGAIKSFVQ